MKKYSFPKDKIKIYLFENIDQEARLTFEQAGYKVKSIAESHQGKRLDKLLKDAHVVGIRSRSKIENENLKLAKRLLAIGCFTVGTDQVSLDGARVCGVPVFNAPHSSTRSVAELTLAGVIGLARKLPDKSAKMHGGKWAKSASGSFEVRGKTLGIIGYGHIGQQVGLLAEALGMNVYYYDIVKKLPLGRAIQTETLDKVLSVSNFITIHVPSTPETANMIKAAELSKVRKGGYLLNLSRGNVVDIAALAKALRSKTLAGAAIDVYPSEPKSNEDSFKSALRGLDNVILSPHIGGSTEEAQKNIGREVAQALVRFLDNGSTQGAVGFPQVHMPAFPGTHRILNVHKNVPGVLSEVNAIISGIGANINAQHLSTFEDIGYLIMDLNKELAEEAHQKIANLPSSIKTRILY